MRTVTNVFEDHIEIWPKVGIHWMAWSDGSKHILHTTEWADKGRAEVEFKTLRDALESTKSIREVNPEP